MSAKHNPLCPHHTAVTLPVTMIRADNSAIVVTLTFAYSFSGLRNLKSPRSSGSLKLSVTLIFPLYNSGPLDTQILDPWMESTNSSVDRYSHSYSHPLIFGPMT